MAPRKNRRIVNFIIRSQCQGREGGAVRSWWQATMDSYSFVQIIGTMTFTLQKKNSHCIQHSSCIDFLAWGEPAIDCLLPYKLVLYTFPWCAFHQPASREKVLWHDVIGVLAVPFLRTLQSLLKHFPFFCRHISETNERGVSSGPSERVGSQGHEHTRCIKEVTPAVLQGREFGCSQADLGEMPERGGKLLTVL